MASAGFDRSAYPGDHLMTRLRHDTNFKWCGYYLFPTPSHTSDGSWMGKRAFLQGLGWGLAPLYVGQQVVPPGSRHPSAAQGTTDGREAVALMEAEGFPEGSFVYLDLENGPPLQPKQRDYVGTWCDAVRAGKYQAGVYVSHGMAAAVIGLRPQPPRIWAIRVTTTDPHEVPGPPFPAGDPGVGSHFPQAFMWQAHQNASIDLPSGGRLKPIDLDTALSDNPLV
jgi:hypothetical protein